MWVLWDVIVFSVSVVCEVMVWLFGVGEVMFRSFVVFVGRWSLLKGVMLSLSIGLGVMWLVLWFESFVCSLGIGGLNDVVGGCCL